VYFESMFLGHIPENVKIHKNVGHIYGFKGCIGKLQVNNKEFFITDEALRGKNTENCHVSWCAHHRCHNNGTCISDGENRFCVCPRLYSGKLCQFAMCENNSCRNGATCVPKSGTDIVCLCPYGRSGLLCTETINITQPRFSGMGAFGYTSFLAYSRIPDISFDYEFHLKFQLANNHSALQNNVIFFTGQKDHASPLQLVPPQPGCIPSSILPQPGPSESPASSFTLSGQIIMTTPSVDDHQNKSIISPGRLVGLNVFSQFYVGGYSEYTPDLLPNGADFKNGFQAVTAPLGGKEPSARRQFPPVTLNMTLPTTVAKGQLVSRCLMGTSVPVLWEPLESTVNKPHPRCTHALMVPAPLAPADSVELLEPAPAAGASGSCCPDLELLGPAAALITPQEQSKVEKPSGALGMAATAHTH
ncbi:Protein eyes shut like protein, partial [Myotis brandtii]